VQKVGGSNPSPDH